MLPVPASKRASGESGERTSPEKNSSRLPAACQSDLGASVRKGKPHDTMDDGPLLEIWRKLAGKLDAEDIERFFLKPVLKKTEERSSSLQKVLLRIAEHGPLRSYFGSIAAECEQRDVVGSGSFSNEQELEQCGFGLNELLTEDNADLSKKDPLAEDFCQIMEAAKDDDTFMTVCLLFDREIDTNFEMIAMPHVDMLIMGKVGMTAIIEDISFLFALEDFRHPGPN